jgi:hypothetical protein
MQMAVWRRPFPCLTHLARQLSLESPMGCRLVHTAADGWLTPPRATPFLAWRLYGSFPMEASSERGVSFPGSQGEAALISSPSRHICLSHIQYTVLIPPCAIPIPSGAG